MAFPVVEATNTSTEDAANVTSHTVNLPTGIVAGETIIVNMSIDGNTTTTFPTADGGWNKITEVNNGSAVTLVVAWREATGSEGSSIEVTTNNSERSAHTSYRISGAADPDTSPPERSNTATGASANPDPGSTTPADGAKDYLWIATQANDRDRTTDAFPTDYTSNQLTANGSGANSAGIGTATRNLNTTTQDPDTFTISASDQWVAQTTAIHPVASNDQTLTATATGVASIQLAVAKTLAVTVVANAGMSRKCFIPLSDTAVGIA